jgi:hypothetical protein
MNYVYNIFSTFETVDDNYLFSLIATENLIINLLTYNPILSFEKISLVKSERMFSI